jgi:hypothetical protein
MFIDGTSTDITVASTGYLGIGTTGPRATLDVRGGHSSSVNEAISFGRTDDDYRYNSIFSYNTSSTNSYLSFKIHNGGSSVAQTETMVIGPGKVGIGTTSPIRKLDIIGASGADSTLLLHMDADTANGETRLEFKADSTNDDRRIKGAIIFKRSDPGTRGTGSMHFCVNNANSDANVSTSQTMLYLGEDGKVQIGNPATGAATDFIIMPTSKLYLDAGGDTYISEDAANQMAFFTGGAKRFALIGGAGFFSGTVTASHSFSDERLKENITVIPNALDKVVPPIYSCLYELEAIPLGKSVVPIPIFPSE